MHEHISLPGRYTWTDNIHLFEMTGADLLTMADLLERACEQNETLRLHIGDAHLVFTRGSLDELLWLGDNTIQVCTHPVTTRGLVHWFRELPGDEWPHFNRLHLDRFFVRPEDILGLVTFRQTDGWPDTPEEFPWDAEELPDDWPNGGGEYSFDVESIVIGVRSREDFVHFIDALVADLNQKWEEWEERDFNWDLALYLNSLAVLTGLLSDELSHIEERQWHAAAKLLLAGKYNE